VNLISHSHFSQPSDPISHRDFLSFLPIKYKNKLKYAIIHQTPNPHKSITILCAKFYDPLTQSLCQSHTRPHSAAQSTDQLTASLAHAASPAFTTLAIPLPPPSALRSYCPNSICPTFAAQSTDHLAASLAHIASPAFDPSGPNPAPTSLCPEILLPQGMP
jgi:hypothetical protein